jgi:hypothetical protein
MRPPNQIAQRNFYAKTELSHGGETPLSCAGCGKPGQASAIAPIPNIPILRFDWRGPKPRLLCDSCRGNKSDPLGEAINPNAETKDMTTRNPRAGR